MKWWREQNAPQPYWGKKTCILNRKLCSSDRDSWSKHSQKSFRFGLVDSTKIFFFKWPFQKCQNITTLFKSTVQSHVLSSDMEHILANPPLNVAAHHHSTGPKEDCSTFLTLGSTAGIIFYFKSKGLGDVRSNFWFTCLSKTVKPNHFCPVFSYLENLILAHA